MINGLDRPTERDAIDEVVRAEHAIAYGAVDTDDSIRAAVQAHPE
ncbi:hypothetical protein ACIBG0_05130 [Nocardia sp. NPDC050630]